MLMWPQFEIVTPSGSVQSLISLLNDEDEERVLVEALVKSWQVSLSSSPARVRSTANSPKDPSALMPARNEPAGSAKATHLWFVPSHRWAVMSRVKGPLPWKS